MRRYIWLGVVVVAIIVAALLVKHRSDTSQAPEIASSQAGTATPAVSGEATTGASTTAASTTGASTAGAAGSAAGTAGTAASAESPPAAQPSAPAATTAANTAATNTTTATTGSTTTATAGAAAPSTSAAAASPPAAGTATATTLNATTVTLSTQPAAAGGSSSSTQQAALPADTGSAAATSGSQPPPSATAAPSFDIVRVDPAGSLVIAGRAAPGSAVTVTSDGAAIGTATADQNGQWVIIPEQKVQSGNHQLALSAASPSGGTVPADRLVMLAVPAAGKNIAGETVAAADGTTAAGTAPGTATGTAAGTGGALALLVPTDNSGGTVVLQQPGAAQPATGTAAAAGTATGTATAPAATNTATASTVAATQSGGIIDGALALDAVDYDDRGGVTIGGRGSIGASVQVYLDNHLIGAAMVDQAGRWQVTPSGEVAPRLHTLRIDQIARDGKVVARVESPFLRAESVVVPADQAFVVQPGNSLWRIARRTYGNGLRYSVIYEANRGAIRNPDLIYPGQVFAIPPTQTN